MALLAAFLLFPSLRRPGLAGYDDAFFAHQAKEMVRTGDWWNERFNGEIILQVPPMYAWLESCSFKLFGVNDGAAKLPSAVLGLGTILVLYFLTFELTGDSWLSLLASIVLASTQFFLKLATHAMTDVPFTFFFTLTLFFYVKGLKNKRYFLWLSLPFAAALLTRSVIAFLAVGIMVVHLLLTQRLRWQLLPWLAGNLALGTGIASIWYVSQYQLHGAEFFFSHFHYINSKIHTRSSAAHWTTVFNYPVALLEYYWPWLPFLVAGVVMQVRAARRQKEQGAIFLLVWILLILVPFSFVETRYPRYILPAFPAFSILSAMALSRCISAKYRSLFFLFSYGHWLCRCLPFAVAATKGASG